jgi:hypothetical protein
MNHCEFCEINLDADLYVCPKCKEYKGIMPRPMWEDNRDRADDEERAEMRRNMPEEPY